MAGNATDRDHGMSERQLALWMLDKMRDSETFLGVLRKARMRGALHVLDKPDIIARHTARLRPLHEGDEEEEVEVPISLAAKMAAIMERDMLSGPEELIEKALAAYIERTNDKGLPKDWQTTIEMARAEIEGRTSGMFPAGFVAELAGAAREEMAREAEAERARDQERGRGD